MRERITGGLGRTDRPEDGRYDARQAAGQVAPPPAGTSLAGGPPEAGAATFRSHLTARGALLGMFAMCVAACLLATWRQRDVIAGLGFIAGCVLAPVYGRREALLHVVISVPVVFLAAEIVAQSVAAQGSSGHASALSVLEGTFLTLANVAPWLFGGTVLCIGIAMFRGLPQCVRA